MPKIFVDEALKHVGEGGQWTWSTYGWSDIEWCAAFVAAVSQVVGILNRCIYRTASAQGHAREGVRANYGKFHRGPGQSNPHVPAVGDLIFFRWSAQYRSDEYDCDHVGIVIGVDSVNSTVHTVEGNTGTNNRRTSTVQKRSYSLGASCISGYFHPDWSLVGSIDSSKYTVTGALYTSATTRKDMTLREIGYLDASYKPSIRSSKIKLSAINYTGLFASIFKLVAPNAVQSATPSNTDTDRLTGNCRIIVDYLLSKGLNAAAACGIAANIFHESSFNTATVGDYGTSFGICQWHLGRGDSMKRMAGANWANNLTGQLDYLWYELSTGYMSSTLIPLQSVANNLAGCMQAADIFVRKFERPANVDVQSLKRQSTASSYFEQVVTLSNDPVSSSDGIIQRVIEVIK